MNFKMNKKGNLQDIFFIMAILFATSILLVILYYVFVQIQTPLGDNLDDTWTEAPTFLGNVKDGLKLFDVMFAFFFLGLCLWVFISAYFIKSYPFMFFVAVFVFSIAFLVGVVLANAHTEMIRTNPNFASVIDDWQTSSWIINRLPIIAIVVGIVTAIILYSKPEIGGGI